MWSLRLLTTPEFKGKATHYNQDEVPTDSLHYLNNGGNGCLFSCEQGNVLILGAPDHWEFLTKMTALRACVWRAPSWAEIHAGEAKNGADGRRP